MTITTKYNLGDMVWLMEGNRPIERKVCAIQPGAKFEKHSHYTSYCLYAGGTSDTSRWPTEEKLFASKEELLASL